MALRISGTDGGGPETMAVGAERATRLQSNGATLLFGQGPPRFVLPGEDRAAAVLEAMDSEILGLRWCRQVHGNDVILLDALHRSGAACVGPGDGLLTAERGIGLLVWTADCVPVLLAAERMAAAVHAGWRGAAAGVVVRAVELMRGARVEPGQIHAYLGPAISGPRYPVGDDVIEALRAGGVDDSDWLADDHVDLRGFVAGQLRRIGINSATMVGGCTAGTPELASYRRDGDRAGRQWSMIFRNNDEVTK